MTYLPPPKNAFDVEWATQNNRIIQQELGRLQPLQARVADLESGKQPLDGDLTAIAALTGTGYIRRTADDTWAISATIPSTSVTGLGTMSTQNATAVNIDGGAIDGTAIGATTPLTGAFTTLSATQKATLSGATSAANATEIRRTVLQYHGLWGDAAANWHVSYSDTAAAKPLIVNVTTDTSNTAPTGGSLSYQVRIQGTDRLVVTSTGASITGTLSASNLAGTTYTPTLRGTVDVNIASSTFQSASYIRVGSAVMATVQLFITPTASGSVRFSISLPVASNLTNAYQLGGNCSARDTVPLTGMVIGSATNDNAVAEFVAATTNAHEVTVLIFYPIL